MKPTDRQQLLFDRLVTLGEWASREELPLRIVEIRGFGSFFRGKPRPQDVDLVLRVERPRHSSAFERFVGLLKSIRYEFELERRFSRPGDALAELASAGDRRCAGIGDEEHRKFQNWIESYSWKMLRPQTIQGEVSFEAPDDYAKRMLRKHLPNLNVVAHQSVDEASERPAGLRCGFVVPIWSSTSTDTAANLISLLSEQTVMENLLKELAYFNVQLQEVKALARLHEAETELLHRIPRRRKKVPSSWEWSDDFAENHPELSRFRRDLRAMQEASERFENEQREKAPETHGVSFAEATRKVEEARKELKRLYQRIDLLEELGRELTHFKSGCAETDLPVKEYVVTELLSQGSQRKKEKVAAFLRELDYPVDRVLRRNERDERRIRRQAAEWLKARTP